MVRIYIVQHAEAKPKSEDPERHITEKGRTETVKIAKIAEKIIGKNKIATIIHSTKTRSKETAEILSKFLQPAKGLIEKENIEPTADPNIIAKELKDISEDVMIVGHLPHLSKLVSLLICENPEIEIVKFRYSCIICLEKEDSKWRIRWMLTPDTIP